MKKAYFIVTIGCHMNVSDSERLAGLLENNNFVLAEEIERADLIIINTCGVKQTAEDRAFGLINNIRKSKSRAKIVITGCLSRRKDVQRRLKGRVDWFLPIADMFFLPRLMNGGVVEEKYSLDSYRLKEGEKYLSLEPKYRNNYSALVPIGNGCNNFCSYCVVPYARGREVYRPAKEVIKEVKSLLKKGFKEIMLVAQNVNSYHDDNYDFATLLKEVVEIPGEFWLRFSSSHPKDMSDELIAVMASSDKICSHLHLALQSGDDRILEAMNRKYTINHYKNLIDKVRKARPGISITTDIIVGFPGETKKQFSNTVKAFKEMGFDMAYLSQYSPRPGTVSAKTMIDNISIKEKKARFNFLNAHLKKTALKANKAYLDREVLVLVDGLNKKGKYYGKTSSNKTIIIDSAALKLKTGSLVKVLIKKVSSFSLEGVMSEEKLAKEKIKKTKTILNINKPKVIVVLGPTASGKTSLGIKLARQFKGEIISADSRQVYRGMDIGSGKDLPDYGQGKNKTSYHLIDIVEPEDDFDLAKYQKLAFAAIDDVLKRKKTPIIVGGSGLYLQAVINNYNLSSFKGSREYRDSLEKLSLSTLFSRIKKLKPEFAKKINNSDKHNPRRLARYLEIVENKGETDSQKESAYDFLVLGLDFPDDILRSRISYRLLARLEEGMIAEVKSLKDKGLSDKKLDEFGLEYRYVNKHLLGEISYQEMYEQLERAIYRFAKRQKTWFRRWQKQGREITWLKEGVDPEKMVDEFLNK